MFQTTNQVLFSLQKHTGKLFTTCHAGKPSSPSMTTVPRLVAQATRQAGFLPRYERRRFSYEKGVVKPGEKDAEITMLTGSN